MLRDAFTPPAAPRPGPRPRARRHPAAGPVDPRAGRRPAPPTRSARTFMIRHRSPQDGRPGRFVPRVEALEDRCVPACNFIVRGSTLLVTAPAGTTPTNDTVILSDNGGNAANNVVGFCRAPFFPNVPISNIQVLTGTGDERVVYNLVGDLTNARTVNVNFGSGNDR